MMRVIPVEGPWRVRVEAYRWDGSLKASWEGVPLVRSGPVRLLAARWSRPAVEVGPLSIQPGDTLLEWFSAQACFNAFRITAPDGSLRGWYVNLVHPRLPLGTCCRERWSYTDLGLDFAVTPTTAVALDEEDAEAALSSLDPAAAALARAEAQRLRRLFAQPGPALAFLEGLVRQELSPGEQPLPDLVARWGPPDASCFACLRLGDHEPGGGRGWQDLARRGQRVAEALAVLVRGGHVLLHRKEPYPEGTVRLLGGGVAAGEDPAAAAERELREETGLDARAVRWLLYARWDIRLPDGARYPMPTYAFLLQDDGTRAPVPSPEERIVELRWEPISRLEEVAAALEDLPGPWGAWGVYRGSVHRLLARILAREGAPA